MKAEIEVMLPQAKEHQRLPSNTRSEEKSREPILLSLPSVEPTYRHLDLGLLVSRTAEK